MSIVDETYATGVKLDVNAPLCRVKVERGESAFLTKNLKLVDVLVTAIVTSIRKTLGVFVSEDGASGLHCGTTGQILIWVSAALQKVLEVTDLRGNKLKAGELPPCLLVNDIFHLRIDLCKRGVQDLILNSEQSYESRNG